ncbi:MAG: TonB-dependent receptor [Acidobacteria bacterium]|nr:TonB-dependent receptor [Acidobacteriota bacterium]
MNGRRGVLVLSVAIAWHLGVAVATAQAPSASSGAPSSPQALKQLSIEDLAALRVTSAGRKVERLSDVAAAITVIRGEDIRRLGITSLPEALRLAPGMQVAQVYGPGWAISARGFNIATSNKLLVLVDGRSVYSPLFSGVFWDVLDLVFSDIDRIEIVRGPGGALWGANAVNGIVNIITKSSGETQGGQATLTSGVEARAVATLRYGGRLSSDVTYRTYAKFRATDQHVFASGAPGHDDVQFGQVGFRIDSDQRAQTQWTLQGDAYSGREGLFDRADTRVSGGNLRGRWTQRWSSSALFQAQVYFDRTNRHVERQYEATRDTLDIDLQQQLQVGARHKVVLGAGLRASRGDDLGDGPGFYFEPRVRTSILGNLFVSDDIALVPDRLSVIVGAKTERYKNGGMEVSPNVRLRVTPDRRQTIWAAVSRAVRTPTRFDTDLRIVLPSGRLAITGDPHFAPETVIAYEAGYRVRPTEWMSLDVAVFTNRYDQLRSQEMPTSLGAPIRLGNGLNARTSGVEAMATLTPTSWWQTTAMYSHLREAFGRADDSTDPTRGVNEANDPAHMFSMRSSFDLPRHWQIDGMLRHVSRLPQPLVPAYAELSARLGWAPSAHLQFSLVGQNLLHARHEEFAAGTPRELFERELSLRCVVRF